MNVATELFAAFARLSMDHVDALIALAGIGLAAFTVFVVYAVVVREQGRK